MIYMLVVAMLLLIAMAIVPATAESSSNKKISVIIGFKDKSDAALVKAHGGDIKYQYDTIPAIAATLPEQAINALKNKPDVAYVEIDSKVHINKKPSLGDFDTLPWGVDRVEADQVHSSYNGSGVNVSVIDTGIDYTHPDLNVVDGVSFVYYTDDYYDDYGHGTHVAGTIAAIENGEGVIGVAPNVDLYALKALGSDGSGNTSDVVAAIDWSINNKMDVISMSLGSSISKQFFNDTCQRAYDAGIVIVASAGNDNGGPVSYPAAYDSVIAVSATDERDKIASFSNSGEEIELAAPGVKILSTYPDERWALMSGTSMAAPHVSGVVALLLSANPSLTPDQVRDILADTATDLGARGFDSEYGYGLVNADSAIESLN